MHGRCFDRWIQSLMKDIPIRHEQIEWVAGHQDPAASKEAALNDRADRLAKKAHRRPDMTMPWPTWAMDEYTPHVEGLGWIESSLRQHVDYFMARLQLQHLKSSTIQRLGITDVNYMTGKAPAYMFRHAPSQYSVMPLWLSKSGQLPTKALLEERNMLSEEQSSDCYFACQQRETDEHIFLHCKGMSVLRQEATKRLQANIQKILDELDLTEHQTNRLTEAATCYFDDGWPWPLQQNRYWLANIPSHLKIEIRDMTIEQQSLVRRLWTTFTREGVQLAGRIWAKRQQAAFKDRQLALRNSADSADNGDIPI